MAFENQGDVKFVFQGVHEQINFGPSDSPWLESEEKISKMVFIGKNLDYEFFQKKLTECIVDGFEKVVIMHKR